MKKNNPLISVIIPVYNPCKYLYRCLDSIVNQTYKNLEIILVDDGSNDGSGKVCDVYALKDERVSVIHQENAGVSRARNVGLRNAKGDYVNFPDSDDYIDLETYEYLINQILLKEVDAVCFEYYITYRDYEERHIVSDDKYGLFDTEGSVSELLFSNRSFLCSKLLPMSAVNNISFFEDIYRDEDTLFCMMALQNTNRTLFIDKPFYHYVQSEESACRGEFRINQLSAVKAIPIMEDFLGSHYPNLLDKWRSNYMHLMVMLYADMYFDKKNYKKEKKEIYLKFLELRNGIKDISVFSKKEKIKFMLFNLNPDLFCFLHKLIHINLWRHKQND